MTLSSLSSSRALILFIKRDWSHILKTYRLSILPALSYGLGLMLISLLSPDLFSSNRLELVLIFLFLSLTSQDNHLSADYQNGLTDQLRIHKTLLKPYFAAKLISASLFWYGIALLFSFACGLTIIGEVGVAILGFVMGVMALLLMTQCLMQSSRSLSGLALIVCLPLSLPLILLVLMTHALSHTSSPAVEPTTIITVFNNPLIGLLLYCLTAICAYGVVALRRF